MTNKGLSELKQRVSGWELEPSSGGCFEVSVDGDLIYSKLETGQFPDEDELVAEISQRG